MRCPVCGADLFMTIDRNDKGYLYCRKAHSIFTVFLDYFINQPEDCNVSKVIISYLGHKTYKFKIPITWDNEQITFTVGKAIFYFNPNENPMITFMIVETKEVTEKWEDKDES